MRIWVLPQIVSPLTADTKFGEWRHLVYVYHIMCRNANYFGRDNEVK